MLYVLRTVFGQSRRSSSTISPSVAKEAQERDERLRPLESVIGLLDCLPDAACVVSRYGMIFASNPRFKSIQHGKNILHHLCENEHDRFAEGLLQQKRTLVVLERCKTVIIDGKGSEREALYDWSICMYMEEIIIVTGRQVFTSEHT